MGGDPNTGTGGDAASIATGDTGERGDNVVDAVKANAREARAVDPAEERGTSPAPGTTPKADGDKAGGPPAGQGRGAEDVAALDH